MHSSKTPIKRQTLTIEPDLSSPRIFGISVPLYRLIVAKKNYLKGQLHPRPKVVTFIEFSVIGSISFGSTCSVRANPVRYLRIRNVSTDLGQNNKL